VSGDRPGLGATLRARVLGTLSPAMIGAGAGYLHARSSLSAEQLTTSSLPAMYATLGAAIVLLGFRLFSLLRSVLGDFLGKDGGGGV
jgi:hypothetical protein